MTYRTAGSRSVEEVSASLASARERAIQAREGVREDLERHAARRDRADGAAPRPAGTRSELSAPVLAEGEGAPRTGPGATAAPDTLPTPPIDEAPLPVHSGQATAPPMASPATADTSAPEQAGTPPAAPERPADPPVPSPTAPEGASQAAAPALQRRTNAEKRAAVLELLQAEPDASDREIARRVDVSPQTVSNIRKAAAVQGGP